MSKSWLKKLFKKRQNRVTTSTLKSETYEIPVEVKKATNPEFITVAALKLNDKIIKGNYNESHTGICIRLGISEYECGLIKGFIARHPDTKEERFVNRTEASSIAYVAGQIMADYGTLYSCSYKYLSHD